MFLLVSNRHVGVFQRGSNILIHTKHYNFPLRDVFNLRVPGGGEMRDPGTRLRLSETLKNTENSFHGTMCHAVLGSL